MFFPLSEADKRTRKEALGVSLRVSLGASCIATMTRLYGFVKFVEDKCLEGGHRQPLRLPRRAHHNLLETVMAKISLPLME